MLFMDVKMNQDIRNLKCVQATYFFKIGNVFTWFFLLSIFWLSKLSRIHAGGDQGLGLAQSADRLWERSQAETKTWKTDTVQKAREDDMVWDV